MPTRDHTAGRRKPPNQRELTVAPEQPPTVAQAIALGLLDLYKAVFSPMFAGSCRFVPSCSEYAAEAIRRHGVCRGTLLAAGRLARCHPFAQPGVDPVPGHGPRS